MAAMKIINPTRGINVLGLFLLFFFSSFIMQAQENTVAQTEIDKVKNSAYQFLGAYHGIDIQRAMAVSTEQTIEFLKQMQELIDEYGVPEDVITEARNSTIILIEESIEIGESDALLSYKLIPGDEDLSVKVLSLNLVKLNDQWLVQYTVTDLIEEIKAEKHKKVDLEIPNSVKFEKR